MKYLIYGAGKTGARAREFFGAQRVECFVDNRRAGGSFLGKRIIALEDVLHCINDYIVIVASERYFVELSARLREYGVKRHFAFREYVPSEIASVLPYVMTYGKSRYMHYDEIMANYGVSKYKNIVIYGMNEFLPYLLAEIGYQNHLDNVIAIVDEEATQDESMGIPIKKDLSEVRGQMDALVINKRRTESPIRDELPPQGAFDILDVYSVDRFVKYFQHPELKKYKDIHKGKRAFIIGNGPSLRVEDLETLHAHHEICFAANRVYKVYGQTRWRADYLLFSDERIIKKSEEDIRQLTGRIIMADAFHGSDIPIFDNVAYIHQIYEEYYPSCPGFSEDITEGLYCGYSVIYDMALQLMAYMGVSEIYLLGLDHSWTKDVTEECNHFTKDYYNETLVEAFKDFVPEIKKMNKAYERARLYSEQNGFKIFNATRGGKLEVFERVDFDSLWR